MNRKELRLEITDEPEIPKGFTPLIKFYINEELELKSIKHKEIPDDLIIECLKQYLNSLINDSKAEENGRAR